MTTLSLIRPVFALPLTPILRNLGRIFGSIAAGQRAANDFRQINARTDARLAADGIGRAEVARIVFERHFG